MSEVSVLKDTVENSPNVSLENPEVRGVINDKALSPDTFHPSNTLTLYCDTIKSAASLPTLRYILILKSDSSA